MPMNGRNDHVSPFQADKWEGGMHRQVICFQKEHTELPGSGWGRCLSMFMSTVKDIFGVQSEQQITAIM
jgi:hypothetical protein